MPRVTEIQAKTCPRIQLEERRKLVAGTRNVTAPVHVLDAQQLTELLPQLGRVKDARVHNERPAASSNNFEQSHNLLLPRRIYAAWYVQGHVPVPDLNTKSI
ncbi:MAG TPA: hypothetical protein VIV60_06655 [Polyangiaceae bacterium]